MRVLRVSWSREDEIKNIESYSVNFTEAREVVLNQSSLSIPNIHGDYFFLGPTDRLDKILAVYCVLEEGFRKIVKAKKADKDESNTYFNHLSGEIIQ
jgi:uncharacterized DUF497 family protein